MDKADRKPIKTWILVRPDGVESAERFDTKQEALDFLDMLLRRDKHWAWFGAKPVKLVEAK